MSETLEVDFKRIPEWLLERRKIDQDWNRKLKAVKLKQKEAQDLTSKEFKHEQIAQILQERVDDLSFLEVEEIVSHLNETDESKQKTFFGGYASNVIRDWVLVQSLYKKGNLNIVDLGRTMVQLVQYDIPNIKKRMATSEASITSAKQRIVDTQVQIKNNNSLFEQLCSKYGIEGKEIDREVPAMINQIPVLFATISNLVKGNKMLLDAIEHYQDFTEYTCGSQLQGMTILKKFIELGDAPLQIFSGTGQPEKQVSSDENEWEIIQRQPIKEESALEPVQIVGNDTDEIDWTKYIEDDAPKVDVQVVEDTALSNRVLREGIITDLEELNYFLISRISSSKQYTQNALLQVYDSEDNKGIFDVSVENLVKWQSDVQNIIDLLNSQKLRSLLTMLTNPKAVQRIKDSLQQHKQANERLHLNLRNTQNKIEELEDEKVKASQELQKVSQRVIKAKKLAETLLKELIKYNVVITGEINKIR